MSGGHGLLFDHHLFHGSELRTKLGCVVWIALRSSTCSTSRRRALGGFCSSEADSEAAIHEELRKQSALRTLMTGEQNAVKMHSRRKTAMRATVLARELNPPRAEGLGPSSLAVAPSHGIRVRAARRALQASRGAVGCACLSRRSSQSSDRLRRFRRGYRSVKATAGREDPEGTVRTATSRRDQGESALS